MRLIMCCLLALIMISGCATSPEVKQSNSTGTSMNWRGIKNVKSFAIVHLRTEGSAEEVGLYQAELEDHLQLRFMNSFAGMQFKLKPDEQLIAEAFLNPFLAEKNGTIVISVWTVGEDDPVAYHIELLGGTLLDRNLYYTRVLGYDSKDNMPDIVKGRISDFIDEYAIFFFGNREKL